MKICIAYEKSVYYAAEKVSEDGVHFTIVNDFVTINLHSSTNLAVVLRPRLIFQM